MTMKRVAILVAALMTLPSLPAGAQKVLPANSVRYMEKASATLDPPFVNNFLMFRTPAGSRYIIDQFGIVCTTPSATDIVTVGYLETRKILSPTSVAGYSAPLAAFEKRGPAPFGGYIWTASAQVVAMSDPDPLTPDGGKAIVFNIFHTDTTVSVNCSGTVYGHTEALP